MLQLHSQNDEVRELHVQLEMDHGCNAEASANKGCGGKISRSRNKTQVDNNKDTCVREMAEPVNWKQV